MREIPPLISLCGVVVLLAWFTPPVYLHGALPDGAAMMPLTAIRFVIVGLMFTAMNRPVQTFFTDTWAFSSALVLVLMGVFDVFALTSHYIGDALVLAPGQFENQAIAPGLPSVATMICFALTALGVLIPSTSRHAATAIGIFATIALAGALFGLRTLSFYFESVSTGMAFLTAILFCLTAALLWPVKVTR